MGPVIDNAAANAVEESFLDLLLKGGRPIKHLNRPTADRPLACPAPARSTGAHAPILDARNRLGPKRSQRPRRPA